MRLTKTMLAIAFLTIISGNTIGQADPNDLAAYYGFAEMEIVKLDWGIKGLNIADFNRDGRYDIAIVNNRKTKIEILIQKEEIGPGEEEVVVDPKDIDINAISAPSRFDRQSVAVSQKVRSFVCGDLNSDGMMDLAFYGEPKGLYVILQKASESEADKSKTLSWRTRKKIKIDDGLLTSNALVCADLNNDGADDLALASRDAVYIILQKADGSLSEPVKYPTVARLLGIKTGDLNGDNINDLVVITNDREKPVHVRFGLKTGQLGPQIQFFIEKPLAMELHNIDGIAGDEILTIDSRSKRLICYKFAAEKEDADWPILFYPLASGEGSTKRDLVVGDFDGDGLADVTISDPGAAELIFYKQTAELGLAEPVRFPSFADVVSLSAYDIDGDGKDEVAVISIKEEIIGIARFEDDRFSFPQPVKLIGKPIAMELADIDGDGNIDCLYISKDANEVRFLRTIYNLAETEQGKSRPIKHKQLKTKNKPSKKKSNKLKAKNKQFENTETTDEIKAALKLEGLTSNPEGLKVLDVDQDGLQDVLIFIKYEEPILVRQTSKGRFEIVESPQSQASLIKEASLRSIAIADMDSQGGKELLVAQKNFARSLIFADSKNWSIIDQYNAKSTENEISAVAAFDIDADKSKGQPCILLLDGQKGQLQILKAGEGKSYRFEKELDVGKWNTANHLKMLFEPLTGTKTKSILLFDSEKFALITAPSGGNVPQHLEHQFGYETKIKDGRYGNLTAGDINSDGWADIVMVEYNHNHIEILALDAESKPTAAMRFKVFEQKSYDKSRGKFSIEPRELKIADVTGDGKDDLVTIIHDRIIIYPQD